MNVPHNTSVIVGGIERLDLWFLHIAAAVACAEISIPLLFGTLFTSRLDLTLYDGLLPAARILSKWGRRDRATRTTVLLLFGLHVYRG